MTTLILKIKSRLLKRIKVDPATGCWLWQGSKFTKGYGCIRISGKSYRAHRISYRIFRGPIPFKIDVCHDCDIKPCINPYHLFLGTHQDNMDDGKNKTRFHKGETRVNDPRYARGENHHNSKLTNDQVFEIYKMKFQEGLKNQDICNKFNLPKGTVSGIIRGKARKDLYEIFQQHREESDE